jgi:hypothetical protein
MQHSPVLSIRISKQHNEGGNMSSFDFSQDKIIVKNYPELIQISEYEFRRTWQIKLANQLNIDLSKIATKLSFYGHEVRIEADNSSQLINVTVTTKFAPTDYLFFNACNLFAEIDYLLGGITEIQGQARDLWYPWLDMKPNSSVRGHVSRWVMQEIQVGLRHSTHDGFSFFGDLEVNDHIECGAKVISVHPGGAITRETENPGNDFTFQVNGFFMLVRLLKHEPSLVLPAE